MGRRRRRRAAIQNELNSADADADADVDVTVEFIVNAVSSAQWLKYCIYMKCIYCKQQKIGKIAVNNR